MNSELLAITIVVAARNEEASIAACMDALLEQTYPCEIIVADGMSTDRTRAIAEAKGVRVIDNPERIAATGFNHGIRAASGFYIGIMSAHAVPAPDYVERCVAAMKRPGAWMVGGRIMRTSTTDEQEAIALATSSPFGLGDAAHNYSTEPMIAETAFPGFYHPVVWREVGLFDSTLVRNQDDELAYRIRKAGGYVWYDPAIVVRYEPRATIGGLFDQYRQYGSWKVAVYRKHPGAIRPRQLVPAAWLAAVVLGLRWPWMWVPSVGLYAALMGWGAARMNGRLSPWIFTALIATHAGYGLGMWQGLFRRRLVGNPADHSRQRRVEGRLTG